MPPVLPFALIVCLVASTLPTPAQARTDPPPVDGHGGAAAAASLLATAIARQADRLVVEREKVRSRIGTAQQSGASIEADLTLLSS